MTAAPDPARPPDPGGAVTSVPLAPPPATASLLAGPRRIHIAGGPGAGKTTLAQRLAATTGLAVHHLDEVARVGGGTGRVREAAEREPLVRAILDADGWITDGVHLGWTEPLLARAELIVWLDVAAGSAAAARIAGRFLDGARAEFRRRSWRERAGAMPGYARHARDLAGAMLGARRYDRARTAPDGSLPPPVDPAGTLASRAATEAALAAHADRVVRCRTFAEVDALLARLAAPSSASTAARGAPRGAPRAPPP